MSYIPTGLAMANKQDTGNTSLASIDNKLPASLGAGGGIKIDGSGTVLPVSFTSGTVSVSNFPATQPVSGSVSISNFPATQPVSGTVTANIGTTNGLALDTSVSAINAKLGSLGQKTSAGSAPVVLASDQSTLPIRFADTANLDAFARLRVSNPETLFDSKQLVDNQPLFFDDQQTTGAGTTSTYLTNQAATQLSVANATAGTRVRQTFQRFNYQPGKSLAITLTGILGTGAAGITRRIGYFDQNNGLFFQLSGTTLSVVVRSFVTGAAVDTVINQANWNLDKLDGTGASGVTFDSSKVQIFIIDFQWLGTGRIRFGFIIGGTVIYVHQVLNANIATSVFMSTPNLPVRYEISNSGAGPAANLIHICASVITDGIQDDTGFLQSVDRGATSLVTLNDANIYPLIAIRLKSTHQMADIDQINFSAVCTSDSIFRYALVLNPTIVGTALSFTGITNSAIEAQVNTTNATTITGGTQLLSGYVDASPNQNGFQMQTLPSNLRLGSSIAGVSDILVLAVQRVTGAAETFFGSMSWRETV